MNGKLRSFLLVVLAASLVTLMATGPCASADNPPRESSAKIDRHQRSDDAAKNRSRDQITTNAGRNPNASRARVFQMTSSRADPCWCSELWCESRIAPTSPIFDPSITTMWLIAELVWGLAGVVLLSGAVSILFLKRWHSATILVTLGVMDVTVAVASPAMLNWFAASAWRSAIPGFDELFQTASFVALFIVLSAALVIYFLPTMVVARRSNRNRESIFLTNLLVGWLPLAWNILLYSSFQDGQQEIANKNG